MRIAMPNHQPALRVWDDDVLAPADAGAAARGVDVALAAAMTETRTRPASDEVLAWGDVMPVATASLDVRNGPATSQTVAREKKAVVLADAATRAAPENELRGTATVRPIKKRSTDAGASCRRARAELLREATAAVVWAPE